MDIFFFFFCLWDTFFFFFSFDLCQHEMTKFSALGPRKSVQHSHMSPYIVLRWKWIWVQNASNNPYNGKSLSIWCLNICKWAQNTYGFSRFFASSLSFAIFKYRNTGVKINPSMTCSRNLSISSSVLCLQHSLEHLFGCHHSIVQRKSLLTSMHLNRSNAGTFKRMLQTNY